MFLPKKSKIFEKFLEQSAFVKEAAQLFEKMVQDWSYLEQGCQEMEKLENRADELVHTISDDLEKTFILPLDKEDVKALTELLDDVVDNLEQVTNRLKIYKISNSHATLIEFSKLLNQAAEQIHQSMQMVSESKTFSDELAQCYKKLHDLEEEGDALHRKTLERLLGEESSDLNGGDAISIIKWKEIFQTLEDTMDICEDVAIIIEQLKIKYR